MSVKKTGLAYGSLIETIHGPVPIQTLKIGQRVFGCNYRGQKCQVEIIQIDKESAIFDSFPGKKLTKTTAATLDHKVFLGPGVPDYTSVKNMPEYHESNVNITGTIYNLLTNTGNYWCEGLLMKC